MFTTAICLRDGSVTNLKTASQHALQTKLHHIFNKHII